MIQNISGLNPLLVSLEPSGVSAALEGVFSVKPADVELLIQLYAHTLE